MANPIFVITIAENQAAIDLHGNLTITRFDHEVTEPVQREIVLFEMLSKAAVQLANEHGINLGG